MASECCVADNGPGSDICGQNSDSTHEHETDKMLTEMASDYSRYFAIDTSLEISLFEESLEEKLMHLEEFCGILDIVRQENNFCLEKHLPAVIEKSIELQELYDSIDKLCEMVSLVRKCVEDMEQQVSKAEEIFANTKIKKFFSSFWNNKRKEGDMRKPKYVEPNIFSVKDLIHCEDCSDSNSNQMNN